MDIVFTVCLHGCWPLGIFKMNLREETKIAFQNILDTMTGADGGVRFIHLKVLIEEMDKRAALGDLGAESIIEVIKQFSRLINVAQKSCK